MRRYIGRPADLARGGWPMADGLWVLDTNEPALRFYDRHGWTDTGRTQVDHGRSGTELYERRLRRDLAD